MADDQKTQAEAPENELINLKTFLAEWLSVTDPADDTISDQMDLLAYCEKEMGESMSLVQELDAGCRPETLDIPGDTEKILASVDETHDLLTLQLQKVELEKRAKDPWYRYKLLDKMKYRARDTPWKHAEYSRMIKEGKVKANNLITEPEVIVTVQVYRSYHKRKHLILEREYQLLGCQMLTELRDAIHCFTDHVRVGDFTVSPDLPQDFTTKDVYKSGLFFIEDTFYNDFRHPDSKDYSNLKRCYQGCMRDTLSGLVRQDVVRSPIGQVRDWAQDPGRGFSSLQATRMETTRVIDLSVKLGQPYLYLHQGNCEHLIIFTDVGILHPDDCHSLDMYPLETYRSRERKPKCRGCMTYLAKWVGFDCSLSPEEPSLFCDTCFRSLHCDRDGKMIFKKSKVYPLPAV